MTPVAFAIALLCLLVTASTAAASDTHGVDSHAIDGTGATTAGVASAGAWCGSVRRTDPPGLRSAPLRYHAVYLVPRGARSRLRRFAPTFQADAFGASMLLERLYGRAIRFDMGTSCGRQYLDISRLRLSVTRARLRRAARSSDQSALFNLVRDDMQRAGFPVTDESTGYEWGSRHPTVNYVAWLDGPAPEGACGQGTSVVDTRRVFWNVNNLGGKLALVFRRDGNFCGADTVRHEIGHNLGALQPHAPHTRDGVHCTDAREDTMCEGGAPAVAGSSRRFFDYGNDDYWDPPRGRPLRWWTLNLSWFICPNTTCNG